MKSIDSNTSCRRVLRKLKSTWQSVPSHLKYNTAQQWAGQTGTVTILHFLRLDYLYTEFLLHNLLASSNEISRESVLKTAHEILKTVLLPTRKRGLLHSNRADHEWAVSGKKFNKHLNELKFWILTDIAASFLCHALC